MGTFGSLNCTSPTGLTDEEGTGGGGGSKGDGDKAQAGTSGRKPPIKENPDDCSYGTRCYDLKNTLYGGEGGSPDKKKGDGGQGGDTERGEGGESGRGGGGVVRPPRPGSGGTTGTGGTTANAGASSWYGYAGASGMSNLTPPTTYDGVNGTTGCCLNAENLYFYDTTAGAVTHVSCSDSCGWNLGFYKCGAQGKDPSGKKSPVCK